MFEASCITGDRFGKVDTMNLTQKVLLLATVPLLLVISVITFVVTYQAQSLSKYEIASFECAMQIGRASCRERV